MTQEILPIDILHHISNSMEGWVDYERENYWSIGAVYEDCRGEAMMDFTVENQETGIVKTWVLTCQVD